MQLGCKASLVPGHVCVMRHPKACIKIASVLLPDAGQVDMVWSHAQMDLFFCVHVRVFCFEDAELL